MAEALLYQSVIQKLGQLNPNDLSQYLSDIATFLVIEPNLLILNLQIV